MKIDDSTKEQITRELESFCGVKGSANMASKELDVSGATISKILQGDDDSIADTMWRKLAKNLGMRIEDKWQHAETIPYKRLSGFFDDASQYGNVFGLVCSPGSGKTDTLNHYIKSKRDVFYVKCERHMPETTLLRKLLLTMGRNVGTNNVTELLAEVRVQSAKKENPVIIIDEFEKVKTGVFLLFIDLYNILDGRCGIVLIGTENLRDVVEQGYQRGKLGYNEVYSRLGGKFIMIPPPNEADAALVIRANGIEAAMDIAHIINDSRNDKNVIDLRRVKRLVHALKQKEAAK